MSKLINLLVLSIALALIFTTGCKDKSVAPVELQPAKTDSPLITETSKQIKEAVPVLSVEPVPTAVINQAVIENKSDSADHDVWMTDYKAAMKKAAAEKKDMLIDFSGSDWCGWCIKLDEEVFGDTKFIEAASKDFVFVMLDFPKDQSLTTPVIQAQNEVLKEKYGMEGFPAVYLTDAKGRPYAQTGYKAGGPDEYLTHLSELKEIKVKFDELIAKANDTQTDDSQKAVFTDQAIRLLPPEMIVNFYRDEIDTIIALDSENKAGLRDRHRVNLVLWDAGQQLNLGNIDKAIELVDSTIIEYKVTGETAQEVYYFKAIVLDAKGDKSATLASLNKAIEVAPDSEMANHIKEIVKNNFPAETTE